MANFVMNKFCFCINLRVGCFIIAYLKLTLGGLLAIFLNVAVTFGSVLMTHEDDGKQKHHYTDRVYGEMLILYAGILLLITIIALAFIITLIVGLHEKRRGHVKVYLIYATVFLILHLIAFPVYGTFFGTCNLILHPIFILLQIYFLTVIRSYYISMNYSNELSQNKV